MASTLGLVLGLLCVGLREAAAAPLDFEGLDSACDATTPATGDVPSGYGGFEWVQYSAASGPAALQVECDAHFQGAYGNSYGAPSASYAAYNAFGFGEVDVFRTAGTFDFHGAWFGTFSHNDQFDSYSALSIALLGYRPGDALDNATYFIAFDLSPTAYVPFIDDWTGLSTLVFLAGDGQAGEQATLYGGDGRVFLVDDADLKVQPVPEPATMFLVGSGFVIVVGALRRRRRRSRTVPTHSESAR